MGHPVAFSAEKFNFPKKISQFAEHIAEIEVSPTQYTALYFMLISQLCRSRPIYLVVVPINAILMLLVGKSMKHQL